MADTSTTNPDDPNYQPQSRRERRELEERRAAAEKAAQHADAQAEKDASSEDTGVALHAEVEAKQAAADRTQAKEHERSLKAESQGSSEDSDQDSKDSDKGSEDKNSSKRSLFGRVKKEEKDRLTLAQAREENRVNEWAWAQVKDYGSILLYALIIAFVIKTFLVRGFYIPSGSMENTLQVNDRVFINVAGSYFSEPKRGDVVVFKDSQGWIPTQQKGSNPIQSGLSFVGILPDTSSNYLVKRVIGVGGDHIVADGKGKITVNGVEITEPYLHPGSNPSDIAFEVTVPEGKYFMMGDHRDRSGDSRFHLADNHAYIDKSDIQGVVFVIAYPLNHFGLLEDQSKVFENVPNAR
ncbi:MAG: signal peptidase I [Rothia sp. (in: high G+C Gram-positive bacteria)]|uniref:signal peptidase I n=1 Tax=Rothia sp. (in: high G+C Gram-positive bacteria) TaxID=1885016 RepID=UPI0026DF6F60|nr:signal peptidase I [Rothia sp. (in: high G+C Gram-positive bacteria)]MDO5750847.1 signal peptidase I [Rothia sp. (in: high G+C Gram-positive bacteria)]